MNVLANQGLEYHNWVLYAHGRWALEKWTMYTYEEDFNTQSIAIHRESISCHIGPRMEKALPLEVA